MRTVKSTNECVVIIKKYLYCIYAIMYSKNSISKIRLINLKGTICLLAGRPWRTKFRFDNLLGQISIMVINRFVFVLFVWLLFLFCPENVLLQNQVWSFVWGPCQNTTYLLFVLVSTVATVTSWCCAREEE